MSEQAKRELESRISKQREMSILLREVFGSPSGKEALKKISKMCNENEPTYVDQNPNGSAYKEGQRSIIIGIRKMMSKDFDKPKQKEAKL